jgi:hypothetical protein
MRYTAFSDLPTGATFDFINPDRPGSAGPFLRMTKGDHRHYTDPRGVLYDIGSHATRVYHVRQATMPTRSLTIGSRVRRKGTTLEGVIKLRFGAYFVVRFDDGIELQLHRSTLEAIR